MTVDPYVLSGIFVVTFGVLVVATALTGSLWFAAAALGTLFSTLIFAQRMEL